MYIIYMVIRYLIGDKYDDITLYIVTYMVCYYISVWVL